jgi:predicted transcriptional regulator
MAGGCGSRADSLKAQRTSAGHSVSGLAKLANVSDVTITRLENGGTAMHYEVERIAAALGVTPATIGKKDL